MAPGTFLIYFAYSAMLLGCVGMVIYFRLAFKRFKPKAFSHLVPESDRNSTLRTALTTNQKAALKAKIVESRQENRRKIKHSMVLMTVAMIGVAVMMTVLAIARLAGYL
jgi:hypothetical protein